MTVLIKHWSETLPRDACPAAIKWCQSYDSFGEAWAACDRSDWMLWLVGYYVGKPGHNTRRPLVLAACECARLSLPYIDDGEVVPWIAIETAEKWARGEDSVTLKQVSDVAIDAYNFSYSYHIRNSAANATYAAYSAARTAIDAANLYAAADAVVFAAAARDLDINTADTTARDLLLKQCANIVRKYYPTFEEFMER